MRRCPKCRDTSAWQLGDGRFKCRRCGGRFSFTSAWGAVRCSDTVKQKLLDGFVKGLPACRNRPAGAPAINTRERFYRLVRVTCALAEHMRGPLHVVTHARGASGEIVIGLVHRGGRVRLAPLPAAAQSKLLGESRSDFRSGRLHFIDESQAYVTLAVWGDRVLIPDEERHRPRHSSSPIKDSWSEALRHLHSRQLRLRHLHHHLGEVCFRVNHAGPGLRDRLFAALSSTGIQELRPILGPRAGA